MYEDYGNESNKEYVTNKIIVYLELKMQMTLYVSFIVHVSYRDVLNRKIVLNKLKELVSLKSY